LKTTNLDTEPIDQQPTISLDNSDDSIKKKQKLENLNSIKVDFDLSARKYLDWIDNIERILEEKPANPTELHQRQDIIQVQSKKTKIIVNNLFFLSSQRKLKQNINRMMINFKLLSKPDIL